MKKIDFDYPSELYNLVDESVYTLVTSIVNNFACNLLFKCIRYSLGDGREIYLRHNISALPRYFTLKIS